MAGYLSKWSIGIEHQVGPAERDADGYIKAEVLGAWLGEALETYLAQVTHLHRQAAGYDLVRRLSRQPRTSLLGRPGEVLVTATATEVRATEFWVSLRVTPFRGDEDLPINMTCRVSIENQQGDQATLSAQVRDQLIALEQAAEYMA